MDGDGFDDLNVWATRCRRAPATASLRRLDSTPPGMEGFPGLGMYGAFLQGDNDELLTSRGRGSSLPPYRHRVSEPEREGQL